MAIARTNKKNIDTDNSAVTLTQQGYDELTKELAYRKDAVRSEIAHAIKEARDLGDLSENAPYEEAMQKKEMNESRIEELEYIIANAEIIDPTAGGNLVIVGRKVEVEKNGKEKKMIMLVGKSESQQADPSVGKISIDSPVGAALHEARIGDTVEVSLPSGKVKYKVLRFAD
jgi:transcription elongation factor GreA